MRYTIAAPADSTFATAPSCSARSRCKGPGTMTVRSACSRKWSMGSGSTLSIAATTSSAGPPASIFRAAEAIAPRPTTPSACASVSRSPTGSGCRRTAHRGRRQIIARDAEMASTPDPAGRSASTSSSNRRSSGAAVEKSESDSAA